MPRPLSRGQSAAARLTPSSPLTHCIDNKDLSEDRVQNDTLARQDLGYETMTEQVESERRKSDPAPQPIDLRATEEKSEPVMLSPPQSPPSPQIPITVSDTGPAETRTIGSDPASSHPPLDINSCHTVEEYIRGLTTSEMLRPRLDEILNLIWQRFGVRIDPLRLKLEILHKQRQDLLASWGDDVKALLDGDSLEAYQNRLMLDDIDNQVRLLNVPP